MAGGSKLGLKPAAGIWKDLAGRSIWYLSDWKDGFNGGVHIFAPATYVFFASAIPALTFGEQLSDQTEGQLNGVHVLLATALCGVIQSFVGGQPLLIVGVAQPIVLVYAYMFIIAKQYNIPYLPFASMTLFWGAIEVAVLSLFNTCSYIHHFTRFSGELFGFLIGILFLQQAVRGLSSEFAPPKLKQLAGVSTYTESEESSWLMFNGAFALFLACGLLGLSLLSIHARRWNLFNSVVRRIIADYGTAIAILIWTLVSFIPSGTPEGIPRRLVIPNAFEGDWLVNFGVLERMTELEGWHVGVALIPATIIAVLFFFDHNVSSQLAQEGLHLKKPTAYHWDFMLLAIMMVVCGCIGVPPPNGAIPQAPMHSRANTVWLKEKKKNSKKHRDSLIHDDDTFGVDGAPFNVHDDIHGGRDFYIRENRLSNLLQSLLCALCLLITPVLQLIPRSVLWGFFAFMAVEGLPGSQFYKRIKLYMTDGTRFHKLTDDPKHDTFLSRVQLSTIFKFTACQIFGLAVCYGITWAGIAGISFPLFIMLLVPMREHLFPKFFSEADLAELDPLNLTADPELSSESSDEEATKPSMVQSRGLGGNTTPLRSSTSMPVPPMPPSMSMGPMGMGGMPVSGMGPMGGVSGMGGVGGMHVQPSHMHMPVFFSSPPAMAGMPTRPAGY